MFFKLIVYWNHNFNFYNIFNMLLTVCSQMVVRVSALCAGCPLLPGRFLVLISVRGLVNPRAIVQLGRIRPIEKSSDLIGN
jgi:hypothetical protein